MTMNKLLSVILVISLLFAIFTVTAYASSAYKVVAVSSQGEDAGNIFFWSAISSVILIVVAILVYLVLKT